jgi:molybdopterin converting factor small subunit
VKVLIPSPLHSYTGGPRVEAEGKSVAALLADLDRRYPGIRFRMVDEQECIRRHMRVFVNGDQVFDLAHAIEPHDEVVIVQALSGG